MSAGPDEPGSSPRADLADAAGWMALGAAVLAGSVMMDRLEEQDVPPFAAPGLLPGLLGIVLLVMGGLLAVRSVRRGRAGAATPGQTLLGPAPARAASVIGLCVLFGGGLVGHGLPFWAAAALFVGVAILFLRRGTGAPTARDVAFALAVGLGAGLGVTLLFQQLFLVRLP